MAASICIVRTRYYSYTYIHNFIRPKGSVHIVDAEQPLSTVV